MKKQNELYGAVMGSEKVPQNEWYSGERKKPAAIKPVMPGKKNPKGLGRNLAKKAMSAMKEKLAK